MAEIKLYDYTETVDDGWWGSYEQYFYIGQGKLSSGVVVALIDAVPDGEEITVKINSCGGLVFDGWAIYNALIAVKSRGCKVTVRIEGLAASIASIIAMAGDEIIICQAALLMIHKPTVDPFWYGSMNAEELKREALALDQIQAVLNSIYRAKTNLDAAVIDSMINAETYITPAEALTLGFATSIENTITQNVMAENAFNHIFKNADAKTRAYANSTIKINKAMDVQETLRNNTETLNKSNSLLNQMKEFFTNLVKPANEDNPITQAANASAELSSGGSIYYEGTLAVGTEVFSDEAMTTHVSAGDHDLADGNFITVDDAGLVTVMDKKAEAENSAAPVDAAELERLRSENAQLQAALNASNQTLVSQNEALEKIKNVKSTYTPENREQEIIDKTKTTTENGKLDLSKEAREARRAEREEIRNSKKQK